MLSSRMAKYLSKTFEEKQSKAYGNRNEFSTVEQEFYDVPPFGYEGYVSEWNKAFIIDMTPVDNGMPYHAPPVERESIDLRKRPECGD